MNHLIKRGRTARERRLTLTCFSCGAMIIKRGTAKEWKKEVARFRAAHPSEVNGEEK